MKDKQFVVAIFGENTILCQYKNGSYYDANGTLIYGAERYISLYSLVPNFDRFIKDVLNFTFSPNASEYAWW